MKTKEKSLSMTAHTSEYFNSLSAETLKSEKYTIAKVKFKRGTTQT